MNLADILAPQRIVVPLRAAEKIGVISELVDLLAADSQIDDRDAVLRAVLAREEMRTTGIGQGLAVPHAKTRACRRLVAAAGKPATPLDFASMDGRPCHLVILMVSPLDETGPHIQALAKVSRTWLQEECRQAILRAPDARAFFDAIAHL